MGRHLFLKRTCAIALSQKSWTDKRRSLFYGRNELRFYGEFAALLASGGVCMPRVAAVVDKLEALGQAQLSAPPGDEPSEEEMQSCGGLLFLECAQGFFQGSPLNEPQALQALAAVARLHGAAWECKELLTSAASRLQTYGGSFHLSIRNPLEITKLCGNWARFVETFRQHAPDMFAQPEIQALGARLESKHAWVAEQLSANPESSCATLIHGDFKAMNVLLANAEGSSDTLIDFAQTGPGFAMSDVAFLLAHSVAPCTLDNGGEERLINGFLHTLNEARRPGTTAYSEELALWHYRLAVVDYGRFMISRFWGDSSPEVFAKKADKPNVTLPNRNVEAALRFVRNIDSCLRSLEENQEASMDP